MESIDITGGIGYLFAFKRFILFLDTLRHIQKHNPDQLAEAIQLLHDAGLINWFLIENITNPHPAIEEKYEALKANPNFIYLEQFKF